MATSSLVYRWALLGTLALSCSAELPGPCKDALEAAKGLCEEGQPCPVVSRYSEEMQLYASSKDAYDTTQRCKAWLAEVHQLQTDKDLERLTRETKEKLAEEEKRRKEEEEKKRKEESAPRPCFPPKISKMVDIGRGGYAPRCVDP